MAGLSIEKGIQATTKRNSCFKPPLDNGQYSTQQTKRNEMKCQLRNWINLGIEWPKKVEKTQRRKKDYNRRLQNEVSNSLM